MKKYAIKYILAICLMLLSINIPTSHAIMTIIGSNVACDKTVKGDEANHIRLDTDEFVIAEDRNIHAYDLALDKLITTKQKQELYRIFVKSTRFSQGDIILLVGVDKVKVKEIVNAGLINHVLRRIDTQWGIEREDNLKESIQALMKKEELLKMRKEDTEIMMPFKHTMTHEQCQTKTMADMGIGPVEIKKKKK